MDFVFQGFQSALPIWVYILLFMGCLGISWWSYKNLNAISTLFKVLLISLRSVVFFVLLIVLLNPFYRAESSYLENPEILVFLDNSESISLETGNYNGLESYRHVLDQLNFADSSDVNYTLYKFGGDLKKTEIDSLTYNEDQTNLHNPIQVIKDQERNISGSIVISDGIFNQDRNPVFESESINKPIITIGLGDTTKQKDLIVQNVVSNATGYVDTQHPVETTIMNNGFVNQSFRVEIVKNGEVLRSKVINTTEENSSHTVSFDIPLMEEGLRQFIVRVPELDQEWTGVNNQQPFTVDIIDQKQQILSLAFEVHPDVKAIRSLLFTDTNTNLKKRTWLGGDRFLEGDFAFSADSLDLIIIQGFPGLGLQSEIINQLSAILKNVPAIFIATPQADFRNFDTALDFSLPVLFQRSLDVNEVGLVENVSSTEHPIAEVPEVNYTSLSSIYAPVDGLQLFEGATMLFGSTYMGTSTDQPLISVQELGNIRTTYISGFGWYRIFQSSNQQHRAFIKKLFENIISWTATKPDNRRLRIEPNKKIFTGVEAVVLNAFLKNESGQMESNGSIDITLSGESIEERFYSMENIGNGEYKLELGSLPEGIYTFSGTAQKGNRTIDTREGEFSVSKSNAEFISTIRNDQLLNQLSANTGGNYFLFDNLEGFKDSLNKKGMLNKKEKVSETLFFPYQHSFWFIIVIVLLGTEWIIRKYLALP
ncbi:MAG: hypothetical protein U5J95_01870 [Balneolaceae bacterium]|nr:hypothetical protein [Balneolaceae bacterium]